jgi:hypothetical protein
MNAFAERNTSLKSKESERGLKGGLFAWPRLALNPSTALGLASRLFREEAGQNIRKGLMKRGSCYKLEGCIPVALELPL